MARRILLSALIVLIAGASIFSVGRVIQPQGRLNRVKTPVRAARADAAANLARVETALASLRTNLAGSTNTGNTVQTLKNQLSLIMDCIPEMEAQVVSETYNSNT